MFGDTMTAKITATSPACLRVHQVAANLASPIHVNPVPGHERGPQNLGSANSTQGTPPWRPTMSLPCWKPRYLRKAAASEPGGSSPRVVRVLGRTEPVLVVDDLVADCLMTVDADDVHVLAARCGRDLAVADGARRARNGVQRILGQPYVTADRAGRRGICGLAACRVVRRLRHTENLLLERLSSTGTQGAADKTHRQIGTALDLVPVENLPTVQILDLFGGKIRDPHAGIGYKGEGCEGDLQSLVAALEVESEMGSRTSLLVRRGGIFRDRFERTGADQCGLASCAVQRRRGGLPPSVSTRS